jgi:8-oxo-dGTP pyrophosphatase MutT (NUDIX family)
VAVSPAQIVHAAGGVVTRTAADGSIEVLIVHRPRYDDWSLPKGKAEPGERAEETALREVEEETGYRCVLGAEIPTVHYQDHRGRHKEVRFWHMTVISDESPKAGEEPDSVPKEEPGFVPKEEPGFVPNEEVDELRWISPTAAATLLSYDADRNIVLGFGG